MGFPPPAPQRVPLVVPQRGGQARGVLQALRLRGGGLHVLRHPVARVREALDPAHLRRTGLRVHRQGVRRLLRELRRRRVPPPRHPRDPRPLPRQRRDPPGTPKSAIRRHARARQGAPLVAFPRCPRTPPRRAQARVRPFQFTFPSPGTASRAKVEALRRRLDPRARMAVEFRAREWIVGGVGGATAEWCRSLDLALVAADELRHETAQPDRTSAGYPRRDPRGAPHATRRDGVVGRRRARPPTTRDERTDLARRGNRILGRARARRRAATARERARVGGVGNGLGRRAAGQRGGVGDGGGGKRRARLGGGAAKTRGEDGRRGLFAKAAEAKRRPRRRPRRR